MEAPLDIALLSGPEETIKHYEPTIAIMAKSRATQERPTLNEDDLKQLGRMTVLRCYKSMDRDSNIRSFDGLVKDAVRKRILTEIGKEFCVSRGRFLIENLMEYTDAEDPDRGTTPSRAASAYEKYNDGMSADFTYQQLIDDVKELLPTKCLPVFEALLEWEGNNISSVALKKLAAKAGMTASQFLELRHNIQMNVMPHKEELFSRRYRSI